MPRLNVLLRIGLLAALVAGLAAVPSSAALPGSGKIAFAWTSGVFTVDPDGGGRARISDYASNVVWSPDGSKLALVRQDFAGGHLFVADADGTNEHHIYDSTYTGTFVSDQPWSPDGARIVFAGPGGVHTASAEGDDVRTVTTDTVSSPVVWSPMGSLLAYSVQNNLVVSAPDGTGRTQIAANARYPEWSPDGIHLAFGHYVPSDDWGIYVARPDGTELHKVVATESAPTWSPDGSRIGFTSRLGYVGRNPATDAFTVGADGSGLRRLTRTNTGSRPTWSPDGARVLILAGTALRSINPDGTCEYQIDPAVNSWSWRPVPGGAPIGERKCAAVSVRAELLRPSTLDVLVSNEGTDSISATHVVVSMPNGLSLSSSLCTPRHGKEICITGALERGDTAGIDLRVRPRRYSRDPRSPTVFKVLLDATATPQNLLTGRESTDVSVTARACSPNDAGGGRIYGSRFEDVICGRRGRDVINPGPGRDVVLAGAGNDVVYSSFDQQRDRVSCGPGRDVVFADRTDKVSRDCERVRRG